MNIQTDFDAGDEVWTMSYNKAVQCKCVKINIEDSKTEEDLAWVLNFNEHRFYTISNFGDPPPAVRKESELFRTKEELINSIF
jgi:hypothetical protein